MEKDTKEFLEELWLIRNSNFPEDEKGRHYKEMLAQMRRQYSSYNEYRKNNPQFVQAYNLIASMLN